MKYTIAFAFVTFLAYSMPADAQTAQWRGPNRDGLYLENGLLKTWPEGGPELLFEVTDIGDGYSSAVEFEHIIYNNRKGKWVCADWNTGEIMYLTDYENKGGMIYADGMLYTYIEKSGTVALVPATPKEFVPVSTFKNTKGKGPHWAHPSIYNGKLFIRHGDVLQAFKID